MNRTTDANEFLVIYMGSRILEENKMSISRLQKPLKELILNNKENILKGQITRLGVVDEGLKIKLEKNEEVKEFSSIAIWTSVKVVFRMLADSIQIAFLPLVNNIGLTKKHLLFQEIEHEDAYILFKLKERVNDPAILAVVVKSINKENRFECHAFICRSSREAIKLATNMYEVLLEKMKGKIHDERRHSSIFGSINFLPSLKDNTRKPEHLNKYRKASTDQQTRLLVGTVRRPRGEDDFYNGIAKEGSHHGEKRRGCECEKGAIESEETKDGDVLTKVTIRGSGRSLRGNGRLWAFSQSCKRAEGTSPLGFNELFNEFHVDEGLENIDDILNVIINPHGMSFNNLRPIYKEFLLKLTLTLTKDELFRRSKDIMKRQKKNAEKRSLKKSMYLFGFNFRALVRNIFFNKFRKGNTLRRMKKIKYTPLIFCPGKRFFFPKFTKKLKQTSGGKNRPRKMLLKKSSHQENNCKANFTGKPCFFFNVRPTHEKPIIQYVPYCTCIHWSPKGRKTFRDLSTKDVDRQEAVTDAFSEKSFKSCDYETESCPYTDKCYCLEKKEKKPLRKSKPLCERKINKIYPSSESNFKKYECSLCRDEFCKQENHFKNEVKTPKEQHFKIAMAPAKRVEKPNKGNFIPGDMDRHLFFRNHNVRSELSLEEWLPPKSDYIDNVFFRRFKENMHSKKCKYKVITCQRNNSELSRENRKPFCCTDHNSQFNRPITCDPSRYSTQQSPELHSKCLHIHKDNNLFMFSKRMDVYDLCQINYLY